MAEGNFKLSAAEVDLIASALQMYLQTKRRAFNTSSDPEIRAVHQRRIIELSDLGRKFSVVQ